jgi:hypothetical protein
MVKPNVVRSFKITLAEVQKEMDEPRRTASVRNNMEIFMIEKFREGMLLHNPETKEDGLVSRAYQSDGQTMYEVCVPVTRVTWANGYYVSDWAERKLEISDNAELKSSDKPRTESLTA